jgi:UDP-N-acetylglucosamine/UDP-N-acetylgalactosamine diphosphorylase
VTLVNDLFAATMAASALPPNVGALEPATGVTSAASSPADVVDGWRSAGLLAMAAGQVGTLILAGGQGTRLGFDRPKGEYDVGLPSHKVLFRLQAERVLRLRELAAAAAATAATAAGAGAGAPGGVRAASSVSIPVYVMTSPMTDADTRAYWAAQSNFGLPAADVFFFCQGTLPCLTPEGKIMLESGGKVAEAPDGNGGIYRGLHLSGALADMQRRGLRGVHVFAVDNAVVRAADPVFLGYCLNADADVGSKACPKAGPHEKVGVLCKRGGEYTVVEYSEMDKATAELRNPDTGRLTYDTGNICIHYYSVAFLAHEGSPAHLPKVYHVAKKAIPFAHPDTGRTMTKAELAGLGNTGIKLESFIFDIFPAARRMAVLEIAREEEFSPVKNAPGSSEDSPDTARALIEALHRGWLVKAGAAVAGDGVVEVSPLVSYAGEGLAEVVGGAALVAPLLLQREGEPLPEGLRGGQEEGKVEGAPRLRVRTCDGGLRVYTVAA